MPSMDGRASKIKKQKQPHEEPEPSAKKLRKSADGPTSEGASGSTGSAQGGNSLRSAAVREAFARLVVDFMVARTPSSELSRQMTERAAHGRVCANSLRSYLPLQSDRTPYPARSHQGVRQIYIPEGTWSPHPAWTRECSAYSCPCVLDGCALLLFRLYMTRTFHITGRFLPGMEHNNIVGFVIR